MSETTKITFAIVIYGLLIAVIAIIALAITLRRANQRIAALEAAQCSCVSILILGGDNQTAAQDRK